MWMTRVAINNPVFATMVMVALCVLGLFSYARLGVEQMPDVSQPTVSVDLSYPGASPEAVEREVTQPIEEALNSIAGVKRITSNSSEGHSQTSVEFNFSAHMDRAMQEVRDRLSVVQGALPRDARPPTVVRYNDNSQAIVVLALQSPGRSARELSLLADQAVAKRLRRVEGVATVAISGLATRRGAHRPGPGPPARLCHHAGRDCRGAAHHQCRPTGGPAQQRQPRVAAAGGRPGARAPAVCRAGGGAPQRLAADAGRPGPIGGT